jgi:hypothetical protein
VDVGARPGVLVQRMKDRLHGLCNSPFIQHITLLALSNQKILEGWEMLNQEIRTKTKTRSQPIVDASDVAKLLLALVYVLDGLGQPELEAHNHLQIRDPGVKDQQPGHVWRQHLKNNVEVEAAMELSRHLDETGLHIIYTN